jgi:hypothetical protein
MSADMHGGRRIPGAMSCMGDDTVTPAATAVFAPVWAAEGAPCRSDAIERLSGA